MPGEVNGGLHSVPGYQVVGVEQVLEPGEQVLQLRLVAELGGRVRVVDVEAVGQETGSREPVVQRVEERLGPP